MRRPVIAANWKLNGTVPEALKFITAFTADLRAISGVEVVIAPPFTALYSLGVALAETEFKLAAQNLFWEDAGAYTGEVAGPFLVDVGCSYAIIGHSERRQYFGETEETVCRRLHAAVRNNLTPIFCVGETLAEREADRTWEVLQRQLAGGLVDVHVQALRNFVIAYEPVWAIGTGRTATPEQAQDVHHQIRSYLANAFDAQTADDVRILYGGSVKPSNSRELLGKPDIDGALVGGASLDPKQFAAIVRSALT
jgi:triosephosphate isomerase (TIM)